jgi:hypothetical protein
MIMNLYKQLVDWNRRFNRSGLGIVLKSIATGIIILLLLVVVAWLFPSQRHNIRIIAPVLVGLGVGFVYGCSSGPAAWLFGFAIIFRNVIWDNSQSLSQKLGYFAIYIVVYYIGFGLSRLANCHIGS